MNAPEGSPPERSPRLARFGHLDPADGACLMEYVSVLVGEPWSDRPAGTHALLATVARIVNDESSEPARRHLVTRAPALAGERGEDPRTSVLIVEAVLRAALTAPAASRTARRRIRRGLARTRRRGLRLERRAVRRGERWPSLLGRWEDRLYQHGPARRQVAAAMTVLAPSGSAGASDRDERLLRLLDTAIQASARAPRGPGGSKSATASAQGPRAPSRAYGSAQVRQMTTSAQSSSREADTVSTSVCAPSLNPRGTSRSASPSSRLSPSSRSRPGASTSPSV